MLLLHVRLGTNKTLAIQNLILDEQAYLGCIIEAWLAGILSQLCGQ